jgi:GNAT superfamily N-acetyltransferase
MSFDPFVRTATQDDVDVLRALENEARAALVDARGGRRWLETHPALGEEWSGPVASGDVAVAELDGVVLGYVQIGGGGDVVRVEQVYVDPGARECGFGDELLGWAMAAARGRMARVLEGEALPGDRDTKNLYERAGIAARLITVSTPLT